MNKAWEGDARIMTKSLLLLLPVILLLLLVLFAIAFDITVTIGYGYRFLCSDAAVRERASGLAKGRKEVAQEICSPDSAQGMVHHRHTSAMENPCAESGEQISFFLVWYTIATPLPWSTINPTS